MGKLKSFVYAEKRIEFFIDALKFRLFSYLTRKSAPVFLRGADYISRTPTVGGYYEREVMSLIEALAKDGLNESFIDIGANVGLTSFFARPFFRKIYCFEPNPKVFAVLTANLYDFLKHKTFLFNFGLGEKEDKPVLNIPKGNYGGAFILNSSNSYTVEELAEKDGFAKFDKSNYEEMTVEIRKGRDVLAPIFADSKSGMVIKIDVEGFELTVIQEIAAAMPKDARFAIVFENWGNSFNPQELKKYFNRDVNIYKLSTSVNMHAGKIAKFFDLFLNGRKYRLEENPKEWIGTVLLADTSLSIEK